MEKDLRAHILAVVKELYAKHTYADISMAMILKEAGISKGAFYWHFKSKEEAFEAAFQECYEKAVNATHSFDRTGMDALTILKQRMSALLELYHREPTLVHVISHHINYMKEKGTASYPYGDFKTDVNLIVDQGIAEGAFVDMPREYISYFAFLFNLKLHSFFSEFPEFYDDIVQREKVIDTLFAGLEKRK